MEIKGESKTTIVSHKIWQMSQKTKDQLTNITKKKIYLLEQFAKLKKTHYMNLLILENTIQKLTTST